MFRIIAMIGLALLLASCNVGYSARDVTSDKNYSTDLQAGKTYVLLQPVIIVNHSKPPESSKPYFYGFDRSTRAVTDASEFYETHKNNNPQYEGVLQSGAHIQFLFLGKTQSLGNNPELRGYGEILDGPFKQKKIALDDLAGPSASSEVSYSRQFLKPESK